MVGITDFVCSILPSNNGSLLSADTGNDLEAFAFLIIGVACAFLLLFLINPGSPRWRLNFEQCDVLVYRLLVVTFQRIRCLDEGDTLDTKYAYVTHSELNAILNYRGGSLEGSKIYVTLFPCNECAKAIIQSGIKTVIYAENKYDGTPSVEASKRLMNAAGVRYYQYQPTGKKLEINV